jgi:hypothetical protein
MSLGYPTINCSLSGEFNVVSKLVICAMMFRGRHRGLPYELDRAVSDHTYTLSLYNIYHNLTMRQILLPSDKLNKEESTAARRMRAMRRRHTE